MRILFVYADINTMGFGGRSYHFGISILSAALKAKGHQTKLFYAQTKSRLNRIFKEAANFKPDIIAFTSDTTQIGYIKEILSRFEGLKDVFTVLGGCHASLAPECIEELPGLDAICIGEGENTLVELADYLRDKKDPSTIRGLWVKTEKRGIVKNPLRPFVADIDSLPFSDYEIFDYQKIIDSDFGRLSYMLSRGCPFDCSFCASPAMGRLQEGNYVRFMSAERAIAELESLKSKYRFKTIFFADDTFTLNKNFVLEFCQKYKKRINLPFEANARVETISEELLRSLKGAGCFKIHMGIEHGNEIFRRDVLNRKMTNEQIISAFELVRDCGIASKSYNIVGFPKETRELHEDTVRLNRSINPNAHVCYIFQPYPGTELYRVCRENKFVDLKGSNFEIFSRRDTILDMPDFSRSQIVKCHRNFSYKIYKKASLRKALIYKIYYSGYGEKLIRFFSPVKNFLRYIAMK